MPLKAGDPLRRGACPGRRAWVGASNPGSLSGSTSCRGSRFTEPPGRWPRGSLATARTWLQSMACASPSIVRWSW